MKKYNPFHLVEMSPWPLLASNSALALLASILMMMHNQGMVSMVVSFTMTLITSFLWWQDIHREATWQGNHTHMVMKGLKMGMILFIASEILFFVSFFWGFFHSSISPSLEIGQEWPPQGITPFNPMSIPLLNTILLLSSGISITWSHHSMLNKNYEKSKKSLMLTILLGAIFTLFQLFEYKTAPFSMTDSTYGTTFFMATGFHGFHVIVGSTFLAISLKRFSLMINDSTQMTGFECAAWYWHFVDVVWLFLYSMLYWWGA